MLLLASKPCKGTQSTCRYRKFWETHIPYMTGMRDCAAELGGVFLEILEG